jgi:hypothetical protein
MLSQQTKMNELALELLLTILPFGTLDLGTCVMVLQQAEVDTSEYGQYVVDFCSDCDIQLPDVDICYLAFDYILQEARREIEKKTSVDILKDLESEVDVLGNYFGTSYDSKDFAPTRNTIEMIPEEERSVLLTWFLNHLE